MQISVAKVGLDQIQALRALYLQETNCEIRYNACHERGWTDPYLLVVNGVTVGYGSVKGQEIEGRDTIFEYYVIPSCRKMASRLFAELLGACSAPFIECQSNDLFLSMLLFEFCRAIRGDTVLFLDHASTENRVPGAEVRKRLAEDRIFQHAHEPVGDWVVESNGEVVATGGFFLHYNFPFADVYMEVKEDARLRGIGSLLVQELKKQCYLAGRVPAARTGFDNAGSRATLAKAGFRVCGFMLIGSEIQKIA